MLEHNLCCTLAAAEASVNGREDKQVSKAHYIVDQQSTAVVTDELGAIVAESDGTNISFTWEKRKNGKEAYG